MDTLVRALQGGTSGPPGDLVPKLEMAVRQIDKSSRLISELMCVSHLGGAASSRPRERRSRRDRRRRFPRRCQNGRLRGHAPGARARPGQIGPPSHGASRDELTSGFKFGVGKTVEIDGFGDGLVGVRRVRDHGLGIGAEDFERIFQRFERAAAARRYGRMGLGPYIVLSS